MTCEALYIDVGLGLESENGTSSRESGPPGRAVQTWRGACQVLAEPVSIDRLYS